MINSLFLEERRGTFLDVCAPFKDKGFDLRFSGLKRRSVDGVLDKKRCFFISILMVEVNLI